MPPNRLQEEKEKDVVKEGRTPLKKPRIIFLDIDGVLQPNWSQKRFGHDLEALRENLAERFGAEYREMNEWR